MKRFYQILRPPIIVLAFFLCAGLLVVILESALGSDSIGTGGWAAYTVMAVVIFLLYRRRRLQEESTVIEPREQAEQEGPRSNDDGNPQPSLAEVRDRIRRKKTEKGKR